MSTDKAEERANLTQPEKVNTREKILETAIELFSEKGFNGTTTKEIAELLQSSPRAIEFHRNNLRKKFGLTNTKTNLITHLLTLN